MYSEIIATHTGAFHADDVVAVAIAHICFPTYEIVRTRNKDVLSNAAILVDVGAKYDPDRLAFDHHQGPREEVIRENGCPYAAAGLVWKHMGICAIHRIQRTIKHNTNDVKQIHKWIDERLIQSIDRVDCGDFLGISDGTWQSSFGDYLRMLNPSHYESKAAENVDRIFCEIAVPAAVSFLTKNVVTRIYIEATRDRVLERYVPGQKYLVLDRNLPWRESVPDDIQYVIYPANKTTWMAQSVPTSEINYRARYPFPEWYNGILPEGVMFCHRERHLCVCNSRESAISAVEQSIEEMGYE